MRLIGRPISGLRFERPLRVRRIPDGTLSGAVATDPVRRRGRDVVFVRLDSGEHALALSSESPLWRWPTSGDDPFVVMLYRADADRSTARELRRLLDPQRRDALYKAELMTE